ncbi:MAG: ABC-F family ATP-binding cassette domain-containing protein [Oligoflexia bacterium]|nr:ABC-F family ATP-binding cassette domain-containing protein [Oligoflexia bacterium]MBF0366668.1 ABC-F family ATP-binding cassette domain-containing protein [Oligoflexia bacterium]
MSILINVHKLKKAYSARPLFDSLTFSVSRGDRIGLIGPNGAGKSTLLRLLSSADTPDEGNISCEKNLRIGFLQQVPHFSEGATINSTLLESNSKHQEDLAYADELTSKLNLPAADTPIATLSGGWKKRVALARELLKRPDLLLLDEPTNHLDITSIIWLEELLARSAFATITITHDRLFLQKVSNRIIELDRRNAGGLLQVSGDYLTYLKLKEEKLSAQEREEVKLKNTLRRESEWLQRGAKARSTKQQARIKRAYELESEVAELQYRNQNQSVRIDFQSAEKNPKRLIDAKAISKSYHENLIFPKIDLLITPKSRLGILGANGCGKTTLLKILIGEESCDAGGSITHAEKLQVAWFAQNRDCLDPTTTLLKNISPDGDFVDYRGSKVHICGYLARFLFSKEQMDMPVAKLSGGEQARLLIAKLMLKEANILVLDEPTNDLDIKTLDILQEVLQEFPGAILLVSHDRYFLDQVASQILVFNNHKNKKELLTFSSLEQWENWRVNQEAEEKERNKATAASSPTAPSNSNNSSNSKKRLNFQEQRELDQMESAILEAEERLRMLEAQSIDPQNQQKVALLHELSLQMVTAQAEIDRLYTRWEELTSKSNF